MRPHWAVAGLLALVALHGGVMGMEYMGMGGGDLGEMQEEQQEEMMQAMEGGMGYDPSSMMPGVMPGNVGSSMRGTLKANLAESSNGTTSDAAAATTDSSSGQSQEPGGYGGNSGPATKPPEGTAEPPAAVATPAASTGAEAPHNETSSSDGEGFVKQLEALRAHTNAEIDDMLSKVKSDASGTITIKIEGQDHDGTHHVVVEESNVEGGVKARVQSGDVDKNETVSEAPPTHAGETAQVANVTAPTNGTGAAEVHITINTQLGNSTQGAGAAAPGGNSSAPVYGATGMETPAGDGGADGATVGDASVGDSAMHEVSAGTVYGTQPAMAPAAPTSADFEGSSLAEGATPSAPSSADQSVQDLPNVNAFAKKPVGDGVSEAQRQVLAALSEHYREEQHPIHVNTPAIKWTPPPPMDSAKPAPAAAKDAGSEADSDFW